MVTVRGVRKRLEEWNIDIGPLAVRMHEESVVTIPAPTLARGAQADLQGEPLRLILLSAREEAEKVLFYLEHDRQIFRSLQSESLKESATSEETATIADVFQVIEEGEAGVHAAWQQLTVKITRALREETLGMQISSLLEDFYREINHRSEEVARHPAWLTVHIPVETQGAPALPDKPRRGRPRKTDDDITRAGKYPVQTSQEWLSLLHTASDGHYQRHFTSDENRGVLRHQRPNAPFFTETVLSDEERRASFGLELLRQAAQSLDLDDGFIWLYVSDLIAPTGTLAKGNYAGGWIDLDDVARRTLGGYAPNPAEAEKRRHKVWHAIRYGARAVVGGERTVPYFDKNTSKTIDTRIHTTPWQIVSKQQPVQASLFTDEEEAVPVRVELVASREWTALTTSSDTAQFLPMGEMLGAIPPNQPSGAWARSLGLAYFHWCRLHLHGALKGQAPPSRRELLDQFPSKTTGYESLMNSDDPGRSLKYWKGAEDYLREAGFIEGPEPPLKPASRKGWKDAWLADSPEWRPGPQLRPILEALAANLFAPAPRSLRTLKARKRKPQSDKGKVESG